MSKSLFIASTRQDIGKTSISLGLIHLLKKNFGRIAFLKPLSQRYTLIEQQKVSEDALLIKEVFALEDRIEDMSPLIIEKGLSEKYIQGEVGKGFRKRIRKAYENLVKQADLLIIEGTGHSAVGSVFHLSNPEVAKLLEADVLLVCEGGIGRSIDEINLNRSFFEQKGCRVLGVLVNKILQEKYRRVSTCLKQYLQKEGIALLGLLPYCPLLSNPPLWLIAQHTQAEIVSGEKCLERNIGRIIVGTMEPETILELLRNISEQTLLITSADRIDLLLAVFTIYFRNIGKAHNLAGVLLSGKRALPQSIKEILLSVNLPILRADEDIYTLASQIYSLRTKITREDKKKIDALQKLAEEYIDIEKLNTLLKSEKKETKKRWRTKILDFLKWRVG
ncbi:MAG: hypothetical protein DRP75_01420 [Candidatus Omnitrophota bacterium]|nr:MAG: hypothetical protein DRP75_01420 [Candidatus Omnitrophota bacterium]